MSKSVRRAIGLWAGIGSAAALTAVGVVSLRHALETPQPLKSSLPGEAGLYRWQRRSIFYKVLGPTEAPPLVLLHAPNIGADAQEMRDILAPLAQSYRVYAPDLLGFGLSDRPNIEYSTAMYSALCQDFVREVVKEPATLLASGLSCNYAVAAASNAPDLCAALVLISPVALQGRSRSFPLSEFADTPPVKALLYPLLSTRLGFMLMHSRRKSGQSSPIDFAHFYASTHQLGAEHAAMALLAGKLTEDITRQFETLQQPTLLIWGTQALEEQSTIASMHEAATLADPTRRIRHVELIPQADLAVQAEQPEAVAAAIRRWQAEIADARAFSIPAARTHAAAVQPRAHAAPAEAEKVSGESTPAGSAEMKSAAPAEENSAGARAQPLPSEQEESEKENLSAVSESLPEAGTAEPLMAYCVKCKKKTEMLNAREVTMKNGRRAMRGACAVCGTTLNRIGGRS